MPSHTLPANALFLRVRLCWWLLPFSGIPASLYVQLTCSQINSTFHLFGFGDLVHMSIWVWTILGQVHHALLVYPRASPSPAALAGRTGEMGSTLRRTLFRRDLVSEPDLRTCSAQLRRHTTHAAREPTHHAPTQCEPTRARGKVACPTPLTLSMHSSTLACMCACFASSGSDTESPSDQKAHPRQPVPAPQKPVNK